MRKKKGFTLIELLAVIVILAVIALIATPIVIGIIEDSRESAFKSSLYSIFDASEYKLVQDSNTEFPSEGIEVSTLSMNNNKFTSGTVFQDDKGMYLESVTDGKYCGNGYKDKLEVTKGECIPYSPASAFNFEKNTGTILGYLGTEKEVNIPRQIGGIEVKKIGEGAFYGMGLTSIKIPKTVIEIGPYAFIDNKLSDNEAFIYNRNSDGSENKASLNSYAGKRRDNIQIPENITTIGKYAFSISWSGDNLENIVIPNTVTMIGEGAFADNKLTSVSIPSSVMSIGEEAFARNALTSITIQNGVTSIGNVAFSENQLTTIIIPNSVTTIGDAAFQLNKLTSVTLPNRLVSLGISAFYNNKITNITIPNSVEKINGRAFASNQLTSVKIIGKSASSEFKTYGPNIWGWANGYSDSNIIWNATE